MTSGASRLRPRGRVGVVTGALETLEDPRLIGQLEPLGKSWRYRHARSDGSLGVEESEWRTAGQHRQLDTQGDVEPPEVLWKRGRPTYAHGLM